MYKKIYLILFLILVIFSDSGFAQNRIAVKGNKEIFFGGLFDVRHYKESGPFEFEIGNLELLVRAKLRQQIHLIAKGEFGKDGAKLGEDVHILFNFQDLLPKKLPNAIVNARFGRFIPPFGQEGVLSRRRITVQPTEMTQFLGVSPDDGMEIIVRYNFIHGNFAVVNGTPNTKKDEFCQ